MQIGNSNDIENSIVSGHQLDDNNSGSVQKSPGIRARTARKWLRRLGFRWQDVTKNVFIDGHERPDVIEYRQKFLQEMEELSPYIVDFTPEGGIKEKIYPPGCEVGGSNARPIIIITHDESIFSANDGRRQAWHAENETFLRPKGKGKGIMVSDFLLPWSRLNLYSLPKTRQDELEASGIPLEAAVLFEYGKDEGYWDGKMIVQQATDKALPIAETLYPGYSFLFLFDNATSHAIYADDALRVGKMNKNEGGQQSFLRDGWFGCRENLQKMSYSKIDSSGKEVLVQKGVQRVLEERGLWPVGGLNLECSKPKCQPCQETSTCNICVKGTRCESCKAPKVHSSTCGKARECDACEMRKLQCQCVPKRHCPRCANYIANRKGKCDECEKLPPRCTSDGKALVSDDYVVDR